MYTHFYAKLDSAAAAAAAKANSTPCRMKCRGLKNYQGYLEVYLLLEVGYTKVL